MDVEQFHSSCLALDLHADTPVLMRLGYDLATRHEPPLPLSAWGFHVDLPRMRAGGLAAQVFGLPSWPFRRRGRARAVDRLIDELEQAATAHATSMVLVRDAAGIRAARQAGKLAALCGIEGAHALEGDLGLASHFAARGILYLGLLHLSRNDAGAPAYGHGRDDGLGLTDFGRELVDELNRLRVLVDLSHLNRRGFLEAAARSRAPVIVSHTGVAGVHRHPRNIDDEQIEAVARTGGCIGVIFSRRYLGGGKLEAVCAHLEHLIKVGGEDLPALGSDYDGLVTPPAGLEDVSRLPALTAALLGRGLSPRQVAKILGENALRVIATVRG